jgi:hypothetical protein
MRWFMSLSLFYSECSCCRNAESARLQRHPGERSPQTVADCLALILQDTAIVSRSMPGQSQESNGNALTGHGRAAGVSEPVLGASPSALPWNDATRGAYRAQRRKDTDA